MKHLTRTLAVAGLTFYGSAAFAVDCTQPEAPSVPAGEQASQQEMLQAQQKVKGYVAEGQQYIACLKAEEQALGEDAPKEERLEIVGLYNDMVDDMKATSNAFNASVQAYQAANTEDAE